MKIDYTKNFIKFIKKLFLYLVLKIKNLTLNNLLIYLFNIKNKTLKTIITLLKKFYLLKKKVIFKNKKL
jgi:hypothetical protein